MNLPNLKHDYRGAAFIGFQAGPRHELTLFIKLWMEENSNRGVGPVVPIRFGGIENLQEVKSFFESNALSLNANEITEIGFFGCAPSISSKPDDLFFQLSLERNDNFISIHCRNISVGDLTQDTGNTRPLQTNNQ